MVDEMNKPITFQIQIDNPHVNERDVKEMLHRMYSFVDTLVRLGHVRCQMYIGQNSYNGEPLSSEDLK